MTLSPLVVRLSKGEAVVCGDFSWVPAERVLQGFICQPWTQYTQPYRMLILISPWHISMLLTQTPKVSLSKLFGCTYRRTVTVTYRSRSCVSQSQGLWPRCWSPAGWGKMRGCPELSGCGSGPESPLAPGVQTHTTIWVTHTHTLTLSHSFTLSNLTAGLGSIVGVDLWRHHEALSIYPHVTVVEGKLLLLYRNISNTH